MKKATSRLFILATLLFAPVHLAHAQNTRAIPRIGVLYLGAPHSNPNFDVFVQGLRELGYVEGKNIVIEYRYAEGKEDRLPELATELVRLKVDAIFTAGTPALFALKQATKTSRSFSSALAIRLEPAWSLVSPTQVVTSRAYRAWLPTYGPSG